MLLATFATPTTFFGLRLQRLVENWGVVTRRYGGDSLTSSILSSGAGSCHWICLLIRTGPSCSWAVKLTFTVPSSKHKFFFPFLTLTACRAVTHKVVKTFYNCKQIIRVWLESILAVLGLEIKSGSPKWHNEESEKRADRWNSHSICYFVRQLALRKGI